MKVKALGSSGGRTPDDALTSYLLDDNTLLDVGGACSALDEKRQLAIDRILISHSHLDHIYSLAFLLDTVQARRAKPIEIISISRVLDIIKKDLLNGKIWPDFTAPLKKGKKPIAKYRPISAGKPVKIGPYKVEAIPVNHPVPAVGFIIDDGKSTLFYTGDMGPTPGVWQKIKSPDKKISALLTELSFPNAMESLALLSGHLTPDMLEDGMLEAGIGNTPVYISHMKPQFAKRLVKELNRIPRDNIHVVEDGQTFVVKGR